MKHIIFYLLLVMLPTSLIAQQKNSLSIDQNAKKFKAHLIRGKADSAYSVIKNIESQCNGTCSDLYLIYNLYGDYYDYLNSFKTASTYYSKSLEIKDNQINILLKRGINFYNQGNYSLSLDDFKKAIQIKPDTAFSYFFVSRIFAYQPVPNIDSSFYYIEKALSLDSLNEAFLSHKIDLLFTKGNCEQALENENKLLESKEKMNEDDLLKLADIFVCLHLEADALKYLEEYNNVAQSEKLMEKIAYIYCLKDQLNQGIYWLEQILEKYPHNLRAQLDMVGLKYRIGETGEAKIKLKKFIKQSKGAPQLYDLQADIYRNESKNDSALISINKAILKSTDLKYLLKRARIELEAGAYDKANADYLKVLNKDSCNLAALDFFAQYNLQKKVFPESIRFSKQAQRCGYKQELTDVLVQAYFYDGQYQLALQYIDQWIIKNPQNENALMIKALLEACYGNKETALTLCKKIQLSGYDNFNSRLLEALLYLADNNKASFYRQIDVLAKGNSDIFKHVVFQQADNDDKLTSEIKITKQTGFDFILTITLSAEMQNEIKQHYKL